MSKKLALAGLPLVLLLSACGGSDPFEEGDDAEGGESGAIVVGSADFPESTLLAEVYGGDSPCYAGLSPAPGSRDIA